MFDLFHNKNNNTKKSNNINNDEFKCNVATNAGLVGYFEGGDENNSDADAAAAAAAGGTSSEKNSTELFLTSNQSFLTDREDYEAQELKVSVVQRTRSNANDIQEHNPNTNFANYYNDRILDDSSGHEILLANGENSPMSDGVFLFSSLNNNSADEFHKNNKKKKNKVIHVTTKTNKKKKLIVNTKHQPSSSDNDIINDGENITTATSHNVVIFHNELCHNFTNDSDTNDDFIEVHHHHKGSKSRWWRYFSYSKNNGRKRSNYIIAVLILLIIILSVIAFAIELTKKQPNKNEYGSNSSSSSTSAIPSPNLLDEENTNGSNELSSSTLSFGNPTIDDPQIPPTLRPTPDLTNYCPEHPSTARPFEFQRKTTPTATTITTDTYSGRTSYNNIGNGESDGLNSGMNIPGVPIVVVSSTKDYGIPLESELLQICRSGTDSSNNNNNNAGRVYMGGTSLSTVNLSSSLSTTTTVNNNKDHESYGGKGIWYVLESPRADNNGDGGGGVIRVSTCNFFAPPSFSTQISIYTSTSNTCNDGLSCVLTTADKEDSCDFSVGGSKTSWFAEEGRKYYILVHGVTKEDIGQYTLTVELAPIGSCDAAIPIQVDSIQQQENYEDNIIIGSLLGATFSMDPCSAGVVGRGGEVWYQVTGNNHWLIASTCHENRINEFPPRLALYMGECGENLKCATPMNYQQDNDCGNGHSLTWYATEGIQYYILVYKTNFLPGIEFGLTVSEFNPPVNDNCTGAIKIQPDGSSITSGSTLHATYISNVLWNAGDSDNGDTFNIAVDQQQQLFTCNSNITAGSGTTTTATYSHPGVWYIVKGTGKKLTASTCNVDFTDYDTRITVFTGTSCNELQCIADNDQYCGYQSSVDWTSTMNVVYYILVHGSAGGAAPSIGNFGLTVYEFTPTINNDCVDAIGPIKVDSSMVTFGSTLSASVDKMDNKNNDNNNNNAICPDGFINEAPGVWYTVIGSGTGIRVSTCEPETDYDTRITVYTGNDDCDSLQCLISDDNGCGFQSQVYFPSINGQVYYILVHGNFFSSFGNFGLRVSQYNPSTIHDFCFNALFADIGRLSVGSTRNATFDGAPTCVVPNTAPGVWYRISGTGNRMIASTCHMVTDYDTRISVFRGSCTNLECVAGNDDGFDENEDNSGICGSGSSRVSWLSAPSEFYSILVHGWGARTGVFGLIVEEDSTDSIPNDFCIGATPLFPDNNNYDAFYLNQINGIPLQRQGSTIDSTFDNVPVCGDIRANGRGVWYRGVTNSSSRLSSNRFIVSTCNENTNFDTQISVFRGTCGGLECIGGNNDNPKCGSEYGRQKQSSVTFFLPRNDETFYVLVHGTSSSNEVGQFTLQIEEISLPQDVAVNDFCDDAIHVPVVVPAPETMSVSSATATQGLTTTSSPFVQKGSTIDASYDNVGTCIVRNTSPGVWYRVIGTGNPLTATTCHEETDFDTRISIFENSNNDNSQDGNYDSNSQVYGDYHSNCKNLECITGNDDTNVINKATTITSSASSTSTSTSEVCDIQSTASWTSTPGQVYYLLIHGFGPSVGNFGLSIKEVADRAND